MARRCKWYRRAAAQGEVWSHRYLGRLYETGEGVPQDDRQAVHWYRLAAEQGNRLGAAGHGPDV